MDRVKELGVEVQDLEDAIATMKNVARLESRTLEPHELTALSSLQTQLGTKQTELAVAERQLEVDRRSAPAVDRPASEGPISAARSFAAAPGGHTYRELFGEPKASPFKNAAEFFTSLQALARHGIQDNRLIPMAAMNEAVGSEGGFLVPSEYVARLLDTGLESEVVRPRATIYPMTTDTIQIPAWDDSSHAANTIAGFRSYWQAELSTLTESTGKLRSIMCRAEKNVLYLQVSNEMLSDTAVTAQIERKAGEAVSFILDSAFINGSGAGQPAGLLSDPAVALVAKETVPAQPADTICLENITKMFSRMYSGGQRRAVWLCNYDCLPAIYKLQSRILNQAGTEWVGGSQPGFVNVAADGSVTILGRPVIPTEKLPTLGDKGCLVFADLSQYLIFLRQDIRAEVSAHAGFGTDSSYFRVVTRVNGMGSWNAPLTPKVGAATLSWIVVLDTV